MFMRVVVGIDGRAGGRDALALAQQLVSSPDRLVLATIFGTGPLGGGAGTGAQADHAHSLLNRVRADHGLTCRTIVRLDRSPGAGLHRLAELEGADLLVVGSSHRGGLGRVLLGDDTLAAVDGAPCAVAIAPRGYVFAAQAWKLIGVGDDGSAESTLALAAARDLAELHHAGVHVYSIVPLQGVPPTSVEPTDWTTETVEAMRIERRRLQDIPGVRGEVRFGDPSTELTRLSHALDLLVVGSRGQGPLGRLVTGSVSTHLARHSACPLIVVARRLTETGHRASGEPSRDLHVPAGQAS